MTNPKPFKIRCPWKGCDGVIDISKDVRTCRRDDIDQMHFMVHAIICPNCHNSVGNLDIVPDGWVAGKGISVWVEGKNGKWGLKNITKSENTFERHMAMNEYLKPWARWHDKRTFPKIGEIWRKRGPIGWLKVVGVQLPGHPGHDGGMFGVSVVYGDYSVDRNRVKWNEKKRFFQSCKDYKDFKKQMKMENYFIYEPIR